MDLSEYAESLRRELIAITRFAGEDVSRAAEMLAESLDSSVRLALLDVLSAAAGEISSRLEGAVIDVRLTGTEPEFVVVMTHHADDDTPPEPADGGTEDAGPARITLRISENIKARVDSAAAASGMSVNAWLARAINQALASPSARGPKPKVTIGKRYTGFARS